MNQGKALLAVIIILDALMVASLPIYPHIVTHWNGPGWVACTPANNLCGGFTNSTGLSVCIRDCFTHTISWNWTAWTYIWRLMTA